MITSKFDCAEMIYKMIYISPAIHMIGVAGEAKEAKALQGPLVKDEVLSVKVKEIIAFTQSIIQIGKLTPSKKAEVSKSQKSST